LGLPAAAILHQDLAREKYAFGVSSGMDPTDLALYDQYYGRIDPWRPKFLTKREGELSFGEDLCANSDLRKTEFYSDCLLKSGVMLYCSVATIKRPKSFELISIYHGLHDAVPSADTLATINLIIPHVGAALRLRHQLCEIDIAALNHAETLNALGVGVVLVNQQGENVFVSRKAEEMCSAKDGILIKNSQLCAYAPLDHQRMANLVNRAILLSAGNITRPCGVVRISRSHGAPFKISATSLSFEGPLGQLSLSSRAVAAVFIRHPDNDTASLAEVLAATYGMTPAETRIAINLYEGKSLKQTADRYGISLETVKVQLKGLFRKTATHRQSQLIALLSQLIAN